MRPLRIILTRPHALFSPTVIAPRKTLTKPLHLRPFVTSSRSHGMSQQETAPWWAAFGEPQASTRSVPASKVLADLEAAPLGTKDVRRDFLLVDVRRTDYEGGTIASSINLPAHSLYQTRPVIYQLCKQAGIKQIIFYCGSCTGRGPRAAGWMQDYLNEVGDTAMESVFLDGGIKGWVKAYGSRGMDFFDEKHW